MISFELHRAGEAEVLVYDAAGRQVATVHRGPLTAGYQQLSWNGRLDDGTRAASGVYRYVVRTGANRATGKIVWVK